MQHAGLLPISCLSSGPPSVVPECAHISSASGPLHTPWSSGFRKGKVPIAAGDSRAETFVPVGACFRSCADGHPRATAVVLLSHQSSDPSASQIVASAIARTGSWIRDENAHPAGLDDAISTVALFRRAPPHSKSAALQRRVARPMTNGNVRRAP